MLNHMLPIKSTPYSSYCIQISPTLPSDAVGSLVDINIGRKYLVDALIGVSPFPVIGVIISVGYSTIADEDQTLAEVKVRYLVFVVE